MGVLGWREVERRRHLPHLEVHHPLPHLQVGESGGGRQGGGIAWEWRHQKLGRLQVKIYQCAEYHAESQLSPSKDFQIKRIDWTLQQQVGGRKVERGSAGLQESRRRDKVSKREGGTGYLEHQKLHNWHWSLDRKWKGNKLPFIT